MTHLNAGFKNVIMLSVQALTYYYCVKDLKINEQVFYPLTNFQLKKKKSLTFCFQAHAK